MNNQSELTKEKKIARNLYTREYGRPSKRRL